jgi:uncharacterized membrane protein
MPARKARGDQLGFPRENVGKDLGDGVMTNLLAATASFLGIHLLVSGTRLRDQITARIGERLYIPLFAIASFAAIVWLCVAYNAASASPSNTVLFVPPPALKALGVVIIAAALALAVPGVLRGNPTSTGQEKARVDGILRVTRHPFLMGVSLWATFHVIATGTLAAAILFGTFLILAVFGTRAIDRKAERRNPANWRDIAATTSIVPFAAIAGKRNRFLAPEVLDWRITVAAAVFAVLLYFHSWLFSVAPFPAQFLPG